MIQPNSIYAGDAIKFLSSLPKDCAELIIADPPYSLDKDKEFGAGAFLESREQWLEWCKRWLNEAKRILRPKGNIFVYAIHHNACFLQCYMYELGLEYRRQIIWNYENGWSKYRCGPACHYEPILWFSRQSDSTFHTIREPYKSQERLRHAITKNGKIWTPNPEGRQGGDVWKFPTLAGRRFSKERTEHPTQKPLALSRRLVEHFSNPGDMVVVPFVGSGSECVAAIEAGRQFIGAEINPTYVDIASSRISAALSKLSQVAPEKTDSQRVSSESIPVLPNHSDIVGI
ncbi:MAG: site-specific DNA-methyltransferase [Acidobacteria bacterium]|nr:site-specific DNA-methyltransferase [Acidobacteriota bacterium]